MVKEVAADEGRVNIEWMVAAARVLVKDSLTISKGWRATGLRRLAAPWVLLSSILVIACGTNDASSEVPGGSSSPSPTDRDAGADARPQDAATDANLPPGSLTPSTPIPMTANRTWQWVPTPEAHCINDTPTGFGVNINSDAPDKLAVYFEGGGLCFTAETCENNTANRDGYGETQFSEQFLNSSRPYLSREATSPLRDYNMVYLPYCTGDLHAGDNQEGLTFNGRTYRFFGYKNAAIMLSRVLATWPNAKSVVIIGVSAGGYGATFNFERIARAWGAPPNSAQTVLVNDSGTFVGDDGFAPCMQAAMRDAYRFDRTAMADCPSCLANANGSDTFARYFDFLLAHPSTARSRIGFLTTTQDVALRQLASVGRSAACDLSNVFLYPPPDAEVAIGSLLTRTASSKLVHFVVSSEDHTLLGAPQTTIGGISIQSWFEAAIVGGSAFTDLGP